MVNQLKKKVKILRRNAINTVKNHPIPMVLIGIGIGIGWILLDENGSDDTEYDYYRDRSLTSKDRVQLYTGGEFRQREMDSGGKVAARMSNTTTESIREWAGNLVETAREKVATVVDKVPEKREVYDG